jgi:hypothetical protein
MSKKQRLIVPMAIVAAGVLVVGISQHPQPVQAAPGLSTMPVGPVIWDGRVWHQTYAQDFDTDAPLGTFTEHYPDMGVYDGFADTSGHGLYDPARVLSVSNGDLDFWLHSEDGQPLVSTVMPDDYAPHSRVIVSIRYKTTDTPGYKFVGILWPESDDWNQGEVDWPEGDLDGAARPASAIPGTLSAVGMLWDEAVERSTDVPQYDGYNVATTVWNDGVVQFWWNGILVSQSYEAVPTQPLRVTLQAETAIGEPVPTSASGHVDVDWVSIWD